VIGAWPNWWCPTHPIPCPVSKRGSKENPQKSPLLDWNQDYYLFNKKYDSNHKFIFFLTCYFLVHRSGICFSFRDKKNLKNIYYIKESIRMSAQEYCDAKKITIIFHICQLARTVKI